MPHLSPRHSILYTKNENLKEEIKYLEEQKQEVNEKIRGLYDCKDEARENVLDMHEYNKQKENEISETEACLNPLQKDYEPHKVQDDLNLLMSVFPKLTGQLRMARYCKGIRLSIDATWKLLIGNQVLFIGMLRSLEHDRKFNAQGWQLQIFQKNQPG